MFNSDLAVAIQINGMTIREVDGIVEIPFGSEYSIFFKNTSYRKAVVSVKIDGKDVLDGGGLIVDAKSISTLDRSIVSGDLVSGRRFKFIEKTAQISSHRGDRVDDGIITIDYVFESLSGHMQSNSLSRMASLNMVGSIHGDTYAKGAIDTSYGNSAVSFAVDSLSREPQSLSGITTEGSASDQSFRQGSVGRLSSMRNSMSIRLVGKSDNVVVNRVVTTKTKVVCATCGKKNKPSHEYCSRCGSYLRS